MRGHDRDQLQRGYSNEYEDGEGYGYEDEEEEGNGEEEEEEEEGAGEEEDPKPTEEELAFLEMRQRLKEAARKKLKKESASVPGNSAVKKRNLPNDNYGSFFGPSQPVIARRVLEERRSVLETQHLLASKNINAHTVEKKANPSTTNAAKPNVHKQPQKVVNELKMKAQKLKDTRDYSFLLSDDAEPPAPAKEPAPRNVSAPSSDARPAQMPSKSKPSMSKPSMSKPPARPIANGHVERNKVSTNRPLQTKVGHSKVAPVNRPDRPSADPRKLLGSNVGNGPGRPVGSKAPVIKAPSSVVGKKPNPGYAKNPDPVVRKVPLSRPESSSQRQHLEHRREPQKLDKPKVVPKKAVSSSKPQMKPPPKQMPPRPMHDKPSKKRPRRDADEDDDATAAISMIRRMFRYDPRKFSGDDDDLSDMEANFNDIQKEEKRSSQIAKEEDERELRLIEEEERRERMRKEAKKRKLSQR